MTLARRSCPANRKPLSPLQPSPWRKNLSRGDTAKPLHRMENHLESIRFLDILFGGMILCGLGRRPSAAGSRGWVLGKVLAKGEPASCVFADARLLLVSLLSLAVMSAMSGVASAQMAGGSVVAGQAQISSQITASGATTLIQSEQFQGDHQLAVPSRWARAAASSSTSPVPAPSRSTG